MEEIIELCSSIITPAKKSSIYLKSNKNRSNQIADCTRLCALNTSKLIEQINVQNSSITSKDMQVVRKNLEVTAKRAKEALLKMIETTKETLSTSNPSLYSKLSDSCFGVISCVEEIIEIFWEIMKKEKQDLISKHSTKLHIDLLILLSFLNEEPLEEELAGIAIENCEFSLKKLSDEVGKPKFQTALSEYFREISSLTQLCFSSPSHHKEKSKVIDLISNSNLFLRSLIQNSESEESSSSPDNIISNNNNNNNINVNLSHNNYEENSHADVNNNNNKLSEKLDIDNNESNNNNNNNNDDMNEQAGDSPQISEEEINNLVFIPRSDTLSSSSSPPTPTRGISPSTTAEKSSFFVGRKHTPSNQSNTLRDGRGAGSSIGNKLAAQRMRKIDSPLDKENDDKSSEKEDYKKAEKMVEFFMEQFAEFGEVWNAKNETERKDLLKVLSSELDEILQPKLHLQLNRSTTSRELQDIIKMRSIADLAKISFNLPENEEISYTIKQLAESVLSVIVGASTSVIQPSDDIQLESSVNDLYLSLVEVLKRTPVQGFSDSVKRVMSETITLLEEQNNNVSSLFSIDQHVVKAAKGQGAKLIEYQMKMAIWRDCESLRILTTCLISMINSCYSNELTAGLLFQLSSCVRCSTTCLSDLLIHSTTTKHIMMNRDSSQGQLKNENSEEDMNIWNEKNNKLKLVVKEANEKQAGKSCIRAASLNKLVQALTSDKNLDNTFLKTFITTYRSFTTPWQLLSKLLERYDVPSSVEEKRSFAIKLRVAVVVKYWVDNQFYDFDDDLIQKLFQFCETLQNDGQTVAKLLHDLLISKSQERKMKQDSMINIPPTDLTFASTVMNPATLFMNYTDEEIARQITLVDFNIYKSIQVEELLQGAWSSDKLKHRSPNVTALLGRLNKLSFFVPSLILWQERKRDRAFIIAKFIRIAELLRKMNNYNSLMGIVAGLNVSSITRLKHTYLEIDPKLTQQFQVLEKIMDPSLSFKNYRAALSLSKLPTLPYLGVYLTDLTFIEDGNPDNIKSPKHPDKDLINFQKRDMVYNILQQILDFQQTPFPFPVLEPIHTLLTEFPHETERELYSLSTLHEPRNADPKSII